MQIPPLDERIRGAMQEDGRTAPAFWRDLPEDKSDKWAYRAQRAGDIINALDVGSVLDLGCFRMSLEPCLRPGIAYIPSDLVRRDDRTLVCDLNVDGVPDVRADLVTALGVLEHLTRPAEAMADLAVRFPLAIVTYNPLDLVPLGKPRRHFLNDFSRDEIFALLSEAWEVVAEEPLGHQILFVLRSKALARP